MFALRSVVLVIAFVAAIAIRVLHRCFFVELRTGNLRDFVAAAVAGVDTKLYL